MSSSGVIKTALALLCDLLRFARLMCQSRTRLAAENLFLRKPLACYLERQVRAHRTDNGSRITLVLLSQFVAWRDLVTIVRPETFMRWHREAFRLFWRWKSRPRGRPCIPLKLQRLIADMASANRTWGEERIAAELRLKARSHRFAADRSSLSAEALPVAWRSTRPILAYVSLQPCRRRPRLRLLRHGHLSARLRLRDDGRLLATGPPLEPHAPSDGRLDDAAVPRRHPGRRHRTASSCMIAMRSSRLRSTTHCDRCSSAS